MGWKIYAVIWLVMVAAGVWDELAHPAAQGWLAWLSLPVCIAAVIGLLGYAFRLRWLNALVWRLVLAAFVLVTAAGLWRAWTYPGVHDLVVKGLAVLVILGLTVPNAYALYAYAGRLSRERDRAA